MSAALLSSSAQLGRLARHELALSFRSLLAWSLGLCERDEAVTPATLVARFDPDRVPRAPWTFPA